MNIWKAIVGRKPKAQPMRYGMSGNGHVFYDVPMPDGRIVTRLRPEVHQAALRAAGKRLRELAGPAPR